MHIKNGTVKEAMAHELGHASGFFLDPQAPFREGNAELTRVEAIDRYFAFSSDLQHPYPIADPYREDVAQCVIVRKAIGETEYNRIVNHFDLAKKEQMMKDAINSRLGKGTYENTITNNSLPDATSRTDALLQRYEEKTQDLRLHTKIQRLRDYGDLI
jgi:hypothetical protein